MPRDNGDNKHGTRCAGEVAAVAFNNFCGIGVAYNASIGGVRMLDGSVNDAVEAKALSLNPDHIDIYSASWGPEDDGKTVDGPGPLARRAFINGVTTGRKGKGSIFVWASGNGGRHADSCNCDGYTNSIFTLSISSATQGGHKPWYLEECSSTLATTYSSGTPGRDKSIATADMDGRLRADHICTVEHTGTSASAPLAAGLCALALEANPSLTWRDMQHLVVMTSNPGPLMKESDWTSNGVNRKVSHKFGYGLMDGGKMVELAENWVNVPFQHICKADELNEDRPIQSNPGSVLTVTVDATGCPGTPNEVRYIEHVQCKVSLRFFPRGNLRLVLISPSGTASTLLMERPRDVLSSNFDEWPFLSVHYWGENPQGKWILHVINAGNRHVNQPGILRKWQLVFYGTKENPVRTRPRGGGGEGSFFPGGASSPPLASFFPSAPSSQDAFRQSLFKNLAHPFSALGSETKEVAIPDGPNILGETSYMLNELDNCDESCSTCAGPSRQSCLTCAPDLLFVTDLGLCVQHCPDGYFEDRERQSCIGCQGNCASCPEGAELCTSCDHHLILHNHTCIAACPMNMFETDDYRCGQCHESCETCVNGEPDGCYTCPGGRRSNQGRCDTTLCSDHCTSCSSYDYCTQCAIGYVLTADNSCGKDSNNCPPGETLGSGGCVPCTELNNCTKCPDGLHFLNSTCVTSCGEGYYSDKGWCRLCTAHCSQCMGGKENDCLSCRDNFILADGACVSTCPSDSYAAPGTCVKCHHFCTSCSGEGPYACTACAPMRYMDAAAKLCLPCQPCNSTNQHQCCHCDPSTGKCHLPAGKRRITSEQASREEEDEMVAEGSSYSASYAPYSTITGFTVGLCSTVIILFALIFTALQVRSRKRDPLKGGYLKVPIREMRFAYTEPRQRSQIKFAQLDVDDSEEEVLLSAAKS